LAERGTTGIAVRGLKLRGFLPSQQSLGRDANRVGRFFDVALREKRGDGVFHLAREFCAMACHLRIAGDIWKPPRHRPSIAKPKNPLALGRDQSDSCPDAVNPQKEIKRK
jgi:hypothetical protein